MERLTISLMENALIHNHEITQLFGQSFSENKALSYTRMCSGKTQLIIQHQQQRVTFLANQRR